jgi:pimeloyl-ACP methyl ester carboxylesterase
MRTLSFALIVLTLGSPASADDSQRLLTLDHYVCVKSTVPALAGQEVPIYVRERVQALRSATQPDRVAIFVHGAGTPAEVAFDVPQPDYSWMVGKMQTPTLMIAAQHDKQVTPERVRELYTDLGAPKLLVDLGCTSHNAMWEKNRLLLFRASLEWLTAGTVNGAKDGTVRLGY